MSYKFVRHFSCVLLRDYQYSITMEFSHERQCIAFPLKSWGKSVGYDLEPTPYPTAGGVDA